MTTTTIGGMTAATLPLDPGALMEVEIPGGTALGRRVRVQDAAVQYAIAVLGAIGTYGVDPSSTTGLTWGYLGGLYTGFVIAPGTVTLTDNATNFVVISRASGAVSVSTTSTNSTNSLYAKLFKVTTVSGVVTTIVDQRLDTNGLILSTGGAGAALDTDPTLAANSDAVAASQKATKTYVDAGTAARIVGPSSAVDGHVPLFDGTTGKVLKDGVAVDTDTALAANSDTRFATQKATKAYVDNAVTGGAAGTMVFKGVIDCSANPNYPAATAGWVYKVSVAGKIGGSAGQVVEVGDTVYCTATAAAGDQATVGASWNAVQENIAGAVTGPASAVAGNLAVFGGTTGKVLVDGGAPPVAGAAAGSTKQVQYNNAGVLAGRAGFQYDSSVDALFSPYAIIGKGGLYNVNAPPSDDPHHFELVSDPSLEAGPTGLGIQFMRWSSYGATYGGNFHFVRMGGSQASPTATLNGVTFMSFGFRGRDSSGTNTDSMASYYFQATADWTSSSRPGKFGWQVCAPGSATRQDAMILDYTGPTVPGVTFTGSTSGSAVLKAPAVAGTTNTLPSVSGTLAIAGLMGIGSKSANYTLALGDEAIYHPSSDTTARTITIPANASVAFPVGTAITFDNDFAAGALTIAITTDTLVLVGSAGSTGSRTLAPGGQATALKVTSTRWRINGTLLT